MIFQRLEVGSYISNCYIVGSEQSNEAAIIDPGGDFDKINNAIHNLGLMPKIIILTHFHGDHIGAVQEFVETYSVKVYIHKDDAKYLENSNLNFSKEITGKSISVKPDVLLKDGDVIELSELKFEIIHTPGHSEGGICIKVNDIMMTGDTLFNKSIGRTDLAGGSYEKLINSIKEKIFKYDGQITIYPGHGDPSTIISEKTHNPFFK